MQPSRLRRWWSPSARARGEQVRQAHPAAHISGPPVLAQQLAHELCGLADGHVEGGEDAAGRGPRRGGMACRLGQCTVLEKAAERLCLSVARHVRGGSSAACRRSAQALASEGREEEAPTTSYRMMVSSLTAGLTCSASSTSAGLLTCGAAPGTTENEQVMRMEGRVMALGAWHARRRGTRATRRGRRPGGCAQGPRGRGQTGAPPSKRRPLPPACPGRLEIVSEFYRFSIFCNSPLYLILDAPP